jgi:hypothetical protein
MFAVVMVACICGNKSLREGIAMEFWAFKPPFYIPIVYYEIRSVRITW